MSSNWKIPFLVIFIAASLANGAFETRLRPSSHEETSARDWETRLRLPPPSGTDDGDWDTRRRPSPHRDIDDVDWETRRRPSPHREIDDWEWGIRLQRGQESSLRCPPLLKPSHGRVFSCSRTVGNWCAYRCDIHYKLVGSEWRICSKRDHSDPWSPVFWTGSQPTCQPVSCPRLSAPSHGTLKSCSRDYGSRCSFSCDIGYRLVGSASRRCRHRVGESYGFWTGSQPRCQHGFWWGRRKSKPAPKPPAFTYCPPEWTVSGDKTQVKVEWREPTARASRPISFDTRVTCRRDKRFADYQCRGETMDFIDYRYYWPFCIDTRCTEEKVPIHDITPSRSGLPPGSLFTEGTHSITYTARDSDGLTATCVVTFTVRVIRCPTIGAASRRSVSCTNSDIVNSRCTFRCASGYYVNGESSVSCQENGAWTSEFPTCLEFLGGSGESSGDYDI